MRGSLIGRRRWPSRLLVMRPVSLWMVIVRCVRVPSRDYPAVHDEPMKGTEAGWVAGSVVHRPFAWIGTGSRVEERGADIQVEKFDIKGDGGTDYVAVDSSSGRVFVSRQTHVMVVEGATGKVVGDIPNTPGVHGAAFSTKANHGFTTNSGDQTPRCSFEDAGGAQADQGRARRHSRPTQWCPYAGWITRRADLTPRFSRKRWQTGCTAPGRG